MAMISVPDHHITGRTGIIAVNSTSSSMMVEHTVSLDDALLYIPAMDIVRRELSKLEDINLKELGELCRSNDLEDFTLALNIMEAKGTKYAHKLLRVIKNNDNELIMNLLRQYNNANYMNLTNDIL